MAYMSQDHKKEINANLKPILKRIGLKGRLSVNNHSTLVLKITEGSVDFLTYYNEHGRKQRELRPEYGPWSDVDHTDVNIYWYKDHFDEFAAGVIEEILEVMNGKNTSRKNYDDSDSQTDYFSVGWYNEIRIGTWNKPYKYTGGDFLSHER